MARYRTSSNDVSTAARGEPGRLRVRSLSLRLIDRLCVRLDSKRASCLFVAPGAATRGDSLSTNISELSLQLIERLFLRRDCLRLFFRYGLGCRPGLDKYLFQGWILSL